MADPRVTIVIPAYRAAHTIAAAVESALQQTHSPLSVTVVNDGSPDSDQMGAALAPFLSSIHYIQQQNRGVSLARNAAILASESEWIAFLDADDEYFPHAIETLLRNAQATDSALVYGNAILVGTRHPEGTTYMEVCPSAGPATVEALLSGACIPLTSSVLARRDAIVAAGMFDASQHQAEDLDLWLRIAFNGNKVSYTKEQVVRRRDDRGVGAGSDSRKMMLGEMKVMERVAARKDIGDETRSVAVERIQRLKKKIRKETIRANPLVWQIVHSRLWCSVRHERFSGHCYECDRQW